MTDQYTEAYRDPRIAGELVERIHSTARSPMRIMEVCGTHTTAIFRHGIRSLLPDTIDLLSGPGCPVCVTAQAEIDAFVRLARREDVIIATFGDLMRVPGSGSCLQKESAEGADVRVVYSAMDAVQLAGRHPDKQVVFLGVGFETTAPTIGAAILAAAEMGVKNFFVYSAHKTVPPALEALMRNPAVQLDGLILPGHVSVIIGSEAYRPFFEAHRLPSAVAGFEPVDILQAILDLAAMIRDGAPELANAYPRAVTGEGNLKAQQLLDTVFDTCDAPWRGLGVIAASGLAIRPELAAFDAQAVFDIRPGETPEPKGCACGEILSGIKTPGQCALFAKSCTPMNPVGPCMVSSEGTCAAFYRYNPPAERQAGRKTD
jgi:hydrogenase expression/formation protein HypD